MKIKKYLYFFVMTLNLIFLQQFMPVHSYATIIDYKTLSIPGKSWTVPMGVSNDGKIAGYFQNSGIYDGFVYSENDYTFPINTLGPGLTFFTDINNSGSVSGYYIKTGEKPRGILYNATFEYYSVFASPSNVPPNSSEYQTRNVGTNDHGHVAGFNMWYNVSNNPETYAYVIYDKTDDTYDLQWMPGSIINPSFLIDVNGINNSGQIIGNFYNYNSFRDRNIESGFIYNFNNDQLQTIVYNEYINGIQTFYQTYLTGINDRGQVVGYYLTEFDTMNTETGFIFDLNTNIYKRISFPGNPRTLPQDINDLGTIVGYYRSYDESGTFLGLRGFTAQYSNPVPEPGTMALLIFGLAGLAVFRKMFYL